MDRKDMKFDVKYLMNHEHKPDSSWLSYMGNEEYQDSMKVWENAETDVLYNNLYVEYDSCDCGHGYGCSHGSWPFEVDNGVDGQSISFEDEGIVIEGANGSVFLKSLDFTMAEFEMYCKAVGYTLTHKQ